MLSDVSVEKNVSQQTLSAVISVKKRNGEITRFDLSKITQAIAKAGKATGEFTMDTATHFSLKVLAILQHNTGLDLPDVEAIQNIVEEVLLNSVYKKTAKAYILYREQHAHLRAIVTKSNVDLINQYLHKSDWQVKENSNMTYSLQGLNNYIASELSKTYWLENLYPSEVRSAHENGDFHIHDLNTLAVYCVGWDLQDLLREGFKGVAGKIECSPPKHFRTALGQITNFFFTLQGEAAGAQAFGNFDTLLAPFIAFDKLSYKEVKQALQEFVYNLNVPTRVGFQTPFTNLTFDLEVPETLMNQAVVVGGQMQEQVYGDFQKEMDVLNEAFWEVMQEGDAKGRVFTFPIPTYNITKGFDWDNPKRAGLWEITAKYGIPYFSNFVNSDMSPEDARSMCCRLRLDLRKLNRKGGGLFGANPLTGSVGVVTLNMPRLALLSKDEDDFIIRIHKLLEIARTSLEVKRKILEKFTDNNLYPYSSFYLRNIKKRFGAYWHNHFSTIGIIGMNEAALNLHDTHIGTEAGQAFAKRTLEYIRDILVKFQEETGHLYNLEATPAEGTSYRLARKDADRFSNAAFGNPASSATSPFYTNSTHLPVTLTNDIFKTLDLQDSLQTQYTGGTVLHLYLGERVSDPNALKELTRTICANYHLPYFTFSPSFSVCPEHGYLTGEVKECPRCNGICEIYSRVVGYLRPTSQWNDAKLAEFSVRKKYIVPENVS